MSQILVFFSKMFRDVAHLHPDPPSELLSLSRLVSNAAVCFIRFLPVKE